MIFLFDNHDTILVNKQLFELLSQTFQVTFYILRIRYRQLCLCLQRCLADALVMRCLVVLVYRLLHLLEAEEGYKT